MQQLVYWSLCVNLVMLKILNSSPHRIWADCIHHCVIPVHVVPRSLWSSHLNTLQCLGTGSWNGNPLFCTK